MVEVFEIENKKAVVLIKGRVPHGTRRKHKITFIPVLMMFVKVRQFFRCDALINWLKRCDGTVDTIGFCLYPIALSMKLSTGYLSAKMLYYVFSWTVTRAINVGVQSFDNG